MIPAGAGRRLRLGLFIGLVALVLDQLSKWAILAKLAGRVAVLPILDFVLAWNRGVSFSMGASGGSANVLLFSVLSLAIAVGLVTWMARGANTLVLVGLGLVVGGALGNVLDRLRYGAVVDFLYVHIGAFDWWPVFNVADSFICVGAALLVFDSLFAGRVSHKNSP